MPAIVPSRLAEVLLCPRCRHALNADGSRCGAADCALSKVDFNLVAGQRVLIDDDDSIVHPSAVEPAAESASAMKRLLDLLTLTNPIAPKISRRLLADASVVATRRPIVLVVGGGTIGSGLESLYRDPEVELIAFDVFPSRWTQFVADAHAIPLRDETVDAVVIQAVLEHVLEPHRVVAEIYRVLRPSGLVYADTPFLQHVHEGPFDFTRFTESGHRWLFRRFALIESGFVAGIGTELSWSVAQAIRSLLPVRGVSRLARVAMTPLAIVLDRVAKPAHSIDGASSVYFYGRKSTEALKPRDMVDHYRGAQKIPSRVT